MAKVNGIALGSVAIGSVFVYAGIKGYSVPQTVQDIVSGKSPAKQKQTSPITGSSGSGTGVAPIGTQTPSAIANDALSYRGHAYLYGGAPGTDGKHPWDCSSFVNWVLGHDFSLAIPGYAAGSYDGSAHGPATGQYLLYGQSIKRAAVQAGDLCVYETHMGIAISNSQMISAETESRGTRVSTIDGMTKDLGEVLFCKRITKGRVSY